MSSTQPPVLHQVRLPRQRLRQVAASLLRQGAPHSACHPETSSSLQQTIKIVCISDTHNLQPTLPPGDLLLHAGDLTEWGSFDEIQAQLAWLSSQPFQHKVVIAGNHDLLFDEDFLNRNPQYKDQHGRTRGDLDFGSVTYLQDESVTLSFKERKRSLTVFGSPWTPLYGSSAFQYPRENDMWTKRVPSLTDILVVHGPPVGFNDIRQSAGCVFLRREIARVRPRLVVFGHIHAARGEQTVVFDTAQRLFDDIIYGSRGWEALPLLAVAAAWSRVRQGLKFPIQNTKMINAAVVDGMNKDVALDAFEVDLSW